MHAFQNKISINCHSVTFWISTQNYWTKILNYIIKLNNLISVVLLLLNFERIVLLEPKEKDFCYSISWEQTKTIYKHLL